MAYKPEQGRLARMAVFWMLWLLIIYGCMSFRHELNGWKFLPAAMHNPVFSLPVLGEVSINWLIALVAIPAVSALVLYRALNKPKYADYLIETENELRKVAWPTFVETRGASIVVIVSVLILMGYLAGADVLLGSFFKRLWSFGIGG